MATEWYLMQSPYDQLSGYESEALNNFATEGFSEILDSDVAVNVELCNFDLSECTTIKTVVQNNIPSTKLQTTTRQFLLPIGTCKAGMYIKYKDKYWLIVGLVDDNMMYEKAIGVLCNYLLTWLNDKNDVVQRWVSANSAAQYNNGETSTKHYYINSDQLLIAMPDDDESLMINKGYRFILDKRCLLYEKSFDGNVVADTSKPVITYTVTRSDSVLFDYQGSGHYEFMATQDEQHTDDGYYVINGHGYWLCKSGTTPLSKANLTAEIIAESYDIYNQLEPTLFMAKFYDIDGNEVEVSPEWTITSDFPDDLNIDRYANTISISVDNKKLVNKSFILSLSADGYETVSQTITIKAFI